MKRGILTSSCHSEYVLVMTNVLQFIREEGSMKTMCPVVDTLIGIDGVVTDYYCII